MTSRTRSVRRILGILKKVSWVENWAPNEKGWLLLARRGLGQVSHEMGGRWKSQNRKNVYLSPCVKEPLNLKVLKSFVPELRSRYVFFEFRDSYVLSLWTFDVSHIAIPWLWYIFPIHWIRLGANTQYQSRPGSNDNEEILNIPQSSRAWASPCLMSYIRTFIGDKRSYPSAETLSVYSSATCNIGPTCCTVKKEVRRKRNTQTRR